VRAKETSTLTQTSETTAQTPNSPGPWNQKTKMISQILQD